MTICYVCMGRRPDAKTVKRILADQPPEPSATRRFPPFHTMTHPIQRRLAILHLHTEGWQQTTIAAYLQCSRKTVARALQRFVWDGIGGLHPKSRAPRRRVRKVTLSTMRRVRTLQQNPRRGAWRMRAALQLEGIYLSARTCGRIMASNRTLYDQLRTAPPRPKHPMPFRATRRHQYWSVDIRYLTAKEQRLGGTVYVTPSWITTVEQSSPVRSHAHKTLLHS